MPDLIIRSVGGEPVAVVARRGSAISGAMHTPGKDILDTVKTAIAGLPADASAGPVPSALWLRVLAMDTSLTPTALRIAMVFATTADGEWLSLARLGFKVGVSPKNASRAVGRLVRASYLDRRTQGNCAIYARALP